MCKKESESLKITSFEIIEIIEGVVEEMKTVIVYYSMSGNTKYVADKIAEKIDADIIRLRR